jgi:hypothetical protein
MSNAGEIIIEPGNPFEFDPSDLEDLRRDLEEDSNVSARTAFREEDGYGVSMHEVIWVWVPHGVSIANTLRILIAWGRGRWKRERDDQPEATPRPRSIIILGPDGRPLKSVVIRSDTDEPEDTTGTEDPTDFPRYRPE